MRTSLKHLSYLWIRIENKIKGPDNPTSQLLPIMSTKGCSGNGAGRKDKGGGERSKVKTIVCDKVVCERWCVAKKDHVRDRVVWERWCV